MKRNHVSIPDQLKWIEFADKNVAIKLWHENEVPVKALYQTVLHVIFIIECVVRWWRNVLSNVVDIRLSTIMHAVLKISLPKNDRALTKPTRN